MIFDGGDGFQVYLIFQPIHKYIKIIANTRCISHNNDPTIKNCLFSAITLIKNADIEKYGYSGYRIGSDRRSSFSFPGGGFGQNVLIFGVDMSSSTHLDNKKRQKY